MNKKSQITAFIILGIVILILIGIIFYIQYVSYKRTLEAERKVRETFDVQPIKSFVDLCVKDVLEDAVVIVGTQGGYTISEPEDLLVTYYAVIAIAYDQNKNSFTTKEGMEKEISFFMDNRLDSCLENLSDFREQGYNISTGEINSSTNIYDNKVVIDVNYPLNIKKGEFIQEISDFSASLPIRLGHIYDIVNKIVNKHVEDEGWIDIDYMSEFDVNISIYPYNETILVYAIEDNQSLVYKETPYMFLFANRFEEEI